MKMFNILIIVFSLFCSPALALSKEEAQRHLNPANKTIALAEFDLSLANELMDKGEHVRLKDVLNELSRYQKELGGHITALSTQKEILASDLELIKKYEAILRRRESILKQTKKIEEGLNKLPPEKRKNLEIGVDASYVGNDRAQGAISSDRNLEGQAKIAYLMGEQARLEFHEKFSLFQVLGDQTQNHDLGINYLSPLGPGKINSALIFRPFTDTSNANNTNAETNFTLDYSRPIDKDTNFTLKGSYKSQVWTNQKAQNYGFRQAGLNYQRRLSETQDLSADFGYTLQDAETAASVFSDLAAGVNYNQVLGKGQKLGIKFNYNGRGYPNNNTSTFSKNELGLNYGQEPWHYDLNLIINDAPANANNSYGSYALGSAYSRHLSQLTNLNFKAQALARNFNNPGSNYAKVNLQAAMDYLLAANQILKFSNLLENASYTTASSSYLHNLFGIKYEIKYSEASALSLGERFTVDNYPLASTKNAIRHQIDLNYSWLILKDITLFLNGGYEVKSFDSPSATQSDYSAYTLSLNFDHQFSKESKTSLVLSNYAKRNIQNTAADTLDRNVSLNLSYLF